MSEVTILKKNENDSGWQFTVRLSDRENSTEHLTTVPLATYRKLTGGKVGPDQLVIKSFEFLLNHEPKESILQEFELDDIGTYHPEWWQAMVKQFS